ncbi:MAG: DUF1501 domain-containing protein, partial [Bryobacteraceae bacterium]
MFSSRRDFLQATSCGFGYLAVAGMAAAAGYKNPLAPRAPHFAPKAKRVIFMFMQGGPSQHETFDYNPELAKAAGSSAGTSGKVMPSSFQF